MRKKTTIQDLVRSSTGSLRMKRMYRFLSIMKPSSEETVLDVGGTPELWDQSDYKGNIVFLNLDNSPENRTKALNYKYVKCDARRISFPNESFDIAFSNSVIEHVGTWNDQREFARETIRVAKRYWIQTPSMHFPIEPHWNFPLFQFLPTLIQQLIAVYWPLSFVKRNEGRKASKRKLKAFVNSIRFLSARELRILYPDGKLWEERLFGFTKSMVIYRC